MRIRATLVALVLAAGLAGSAGAAVAEEGAPAGPSPEQIAHRCDLAQHRLDHLNNVAARLAERIAKIEAKIGSGELTEEQLAKAQARLAKLQERETQLAGHIDMLAGRIAEKCSSSEPANG